MGNTNSAIKGLASDITGTTDICDVVADLAGAWAASYVLPEEDDPVRAAVRAPGVRLHLARARDRERRDVHDDAQAGGALRVQEPPRGGRQVRVHGRRGPRLRAAVPGRAGQVQDRHRARQGGAGQGLLQDARAAGPPAGGERARVGAGQAGRGRGQGHRAALRGGHAESQPAVRRDARLDEGAVRAHAPALLQGRHQGSPCCGAGGEKGGVKVRSCFASFGLRLRSEKGDGYFPFTWRKLAVGS
ncbi:hypothetical protein ON010_g3653 [Phytophthora cinnamomi]|nr:hypothetical protein ON010_g3653 [Phytophthora cinnamomi]